MLPRRKGMKFILAVTGCWFLFIVFVTFNERGRTTNQQQFMQQVASDNELIIPIPQAHVQRSRESGDSETPASNEQQTAPLSDRAADLFQSRRELDRMKALRQEVAESHDELSGKEYGELGQPVTLPKDLPRAIKKKVDKGWIDNAFNQYISDLISVNRSLPDVRDSG